MKENIFKFSFRSKEDRDRIFQGQPWSMNRAHLILKEWDAHKAIKEIAFDFSTFTV